MQKNQKKYSNNQNRWFYYVNLAPELNNDEKLQKQAQKLVQVDALETLCNTL